jgi:hypothetical protein
VCGQPARLGRPFGPSHAIGFAEPSPPLDPATTYKDPAPIRKMGEECSASARVALPPVFSMVHCADRRNNLVA